MGACTAALPKLECRQTVESACTALTILLTGLQAKKLGMATILIAGKTALEEQGSTARCGWLQGSYHCAT